MEKRDIRAWVKQNIQSLEFNGGIEAIYLFAGYRNIMIQLSFKNGKVGRIPDFDPMVKSLILQEFVKRLGFVRKRKLPRKEFSSAMRWYAKAARQDA